jgi:hypothetical protein
MDMAGNYNIEQIDSQPLLNTPPHQIPDSPEFIPASQPAKSMSRKRLAFGTEDGNLTQSKRSRVGMEDVKTKVKNLENIDKICISDYLDDYDSDILVKTYVDWLLEWKILPVVPEREELDEYIKMKPTSQLPYQCHDFILNNFMNYFQVRYFVNNVEKAKQHKVELFNPRLNFNIPQFQLLPQKKLTEVTDIKQWMIRRVQSAAREGSQFTGEFLLLRIIDNIFNNIRQGTTADGDFKHHFALHYLKAQLEFVKMYPIKKINWESKASKLIDTVPTWRKAEVQEIPTNYKNYYGRQLTERVKAKTEDLRSETVRADLDKFLEKGAIERKTHQKKSAKNITRPYFTPNSQPTSFRGRGGQQHFKDNEQSIASRGRNRGQHFFNDNAQSTVFRGRGREYKRGRGQQYRRGSTTTGRNDNSHQSNSYSDNYVTATDSLNAIQ